MPVKKKSRIRKYLFYMLILTILFMLMIQISANIYLKVTFRNIIRKLNDGISSVYRIEYEWIAANIIDSSISVKNLKMLLKPNQSSGLGDENVKGTNLLALHLPVLKVSGINWFQALYRHKLLVKYVLLKNGELRSIRMSEPVKTESAAKPKGEKLVLKNIPFNQIVAEEIKIENFSFEPKGNHDLSQKVTNYNFSMRFIDTRIKTNQAKGRTLTLKLGDFRSNIQDIEVLFPGRMYSLQIKKMVVSEPLSRIKINSLKLIPAYKKYVFSRKKGYRISRITWEVDQANFYHVNFKDMFKNRCFSSDLVNIMGSRIHFFRDRRVMRRVTGLPKKFPQEVFRELNYHFKLNKVKILNGFLSYEEHQNGFRIPGKIEFDDVNIEASHISNHPDDIKSELRATLESSAKFLGKSLFHVRFIFPVYDKNNSFSFSGSFEKMELSELNPILKNSFLKVERGTLNKLLFFASADRYAARGTLKFYYNDLRISVMKRRHKVKRDSAASFIVNQFLRNENPKPGRQLRKGYMFYERIPSESMLKLIWKSFLSGLKSSVGL